MTTPTPEQDPGAYIVPGSAVWALFESFPATRVAEWNAFADALRPIAVVSNVNPVPDQMRILAGEVDNCSADMRLVSAYLRAAAEQLEAAERWQERVRWNSSEIADEADTFLTADTAPKHEGTSHEDQH